MKISEESIRNNKRRKLPYYESRGMRLLPLVVGLAVAALFTLACRLSHGAEIPKARVVNAIIGEAEGENYQGKLAIACTIRARGTLRGVYGEKAPRVLRHKYSPKTFVEAVRAYEESANPDSCTFVGGATGWGNAKDVEIFKKAKWWKHCRIVAVIGKHFYYKEVR